LRHAAVAARGKVTMQPRCAVDPTVKRVEMNGFRFPLGVYPVETMEPKPGYRLEFEPADTGGSGFEDEDFSDEWPDRYVFDIVISAERVEPLFRQLVPLLPGRVYPILDFIGHDAYREVDPYIARVLIGTEWLLDAVRACRPFFFEDGMCGFGALSDDPFVHLFVDEHKIITVRCEPDMKERFERVLAAFDLQETEEPAGADSAAHEHRNVLWTPEDRPDLLSAEEILEDLRDAWQLDLNVDTTRNVDDQGRDLGITPWRCVVRNEGEARTRYAEVVLTAECLLDAEDLAYEATLSLLATDDEGAGDEPVIISADRLTPVQARELLAGEDPGEGAAPPVSELTDGAFATESRVIRGRWLS
jgi:hypothetical protein